MIGHKTNGDWSDVTSIGRNDIVFEGRNKSYGAYYVRKRYNYILLLSLLISLSAGVIAGAIPLIANYFRPKLPVINNIPVSTKDSIVIMEYKDPPKPPKPTPPAPKPPVTNQVINTVPDVTHTVDNPDTTTVEKQNTNPVGTTTVTDHPDSGIAVKPNTDPGPKKEDGPPAIVDWSPVMPKFRDGDLYDYLNKHIQYPALMSELNVQGTVYASFVVETDGSISNVTVMRGVPGGPDLDKEAVRVLAGMPKWEPGSQNGKTVRVRYKIPIHFQLAH